MSNKLILPKSTDFKIPAEKAGLIANAFGDSLLQLQTLETDFLAMIETEHLTKDTAKAAGTLRKKFIPIRTGVKKLHAKLKADIVSEGNFLDAWRKSFTEISTYREDKLRDIELHFVRLREKQIKDLTSARSAVVHAYLPIDANIPEGIGEWDEDTWNAYFKGVQLENERREAERLEAERVLKEQEETKQKEARLTQLKRDRLAQITPFLDCPLPQNKVDIIASFTESQFSLMVQQAKEKYDKRVADKAKAQAVAEAKALAEQVAHEAEAKRVADVKAAKDKATREAEVHLESVGIVDSKISLRFREDEFNAERKKIAEQVTKELAKESAAPSSHETECEDHIECPYCGEKEFADGIELPNKGGLEGTHSCHDCGQECFFSYETTTTFFARTK